MMLLFLHIFFYYFLIYNIYVFIFLNVLYFALHSVKKHIKDNNITKSDNLFLKPFLLSDKPGSNYLYYLDIKLSKYKMYEHGKECFNKTKDQFAEFCSIVFKATEQNIKELAFAIMAPTPQDMMKMIPMLLAQKNNRPMQAPIQVPMSHPTNPLLYDSDDEPKVDDLTVD